jgi:hypothetical protein
MTAVNAAVAINANAPAVLDIFDLFEEFATDAVLETGGAWVPYKGGTEFLIARDNNENYGEAISAALSEHAEALERKDDAAKKLSEELMIDVVAKHILKGWKNVKYKGKMLEYSIENAKTLLRHKDFLTFVRSTSRNRDLYKAKLIEEQAKN